MANGKFFFLSFTMVFACCMYMSSSAAAIYIWNKFKKGTTGSGAAGGLNGHALPKEQNGEEPDKVDTNGSGQGSLPPLPDEYAKSIRENSGQYKDFYKPDLWDRPEFSIPTGIALGFAIDPDLLVGIVKRVLRAFGIGRLSYKLFHVTTDMLIKAGVLDAQQVMGRKVMQVIGQELGEEAAEKIAKNIGQDGVEKALQEVGQQFGDEVAKKIAAKSTQQLGEEIAQKGALKMATRAATIVKGVAPAAKFLGKLAFGSNPITAAIAAIDIMGLILDIVDPKKYNTVLFNKRVEAMKKIPLAEWRSGLASAGLLEPLVYGPIDKLSEAEVLTKIQDFASEVADNPDSPLMRRVFKLFSTVKFNDGQFDSLASFEDFLLRYMYSQPMDSMFEEEWMKLCIHQNGKLVKLSPQHPLQCTYRTRQDCEGSFTWPDIKDNETYVEWEPKYNVCKIAFGANIRETCEKDGFARHHRFNNGLDKTKFPKGGIMYNRDRMNCELGVRDPTTSKHYCKDHAKIDYRDDPKVPDCYISPTQRIFELMFSMYLVRSFR